MGLSYYYTLSAPATASAVELTAFLKRVEKEAQRMGFQPTLVLNAAFDTAERRRFARRLTTGFEDERLKGVALPADAAVWEHNPHEGTCHLLPTGGGHVPSRGVADRFFVQPQTGLWPPAQCCGARRYVGSGRHHILNPERNLCKSPFEQRGG